MFYKGTGIASIMTNIGVQLEGDPTCNWGSIIQIF